jgi:hypothetical protein
MLPAMAAFVATKHRTWKIAWLEAQRASCADQRRITLAELLFSKALDH